VFYSISSKFFLPLCRCLTPEGVALTLIVSLGFIEAILVIWLLGISTTLGVSTNSNELLND